MTGFFFIHFVRVARATLRWVMRQQKTNGFEGIRGNASNRQLKTKTCNTPTPCGLKYYKYNIRHNWTRREKFDHACRLVSHANTTAFCRSYLRVYHRVAINLTTGYNRRDEGDECIFYTRFDIPGKFLLYGKDNNFLGKLRRGTTFRNTELVFLGIDFENGVRFDCNWK